MMRFVNASENTSVTIPGEDHGQRASLYGHPRQVAPATSAAVTVPDRHARDQGE